MAAFAGVALGIAFVDAFVNAFGDAFGKAFFVENTAGPPETAAVVVVAPWRRGEPEVIAEPLLPVQPPAAGPLVPPDIAVDSAAFLAGKGLIAVGTTIVLVGTDFTGISFLGIFRPSRFSGAIAVDVLGGEDGDPGNGTAAAAAAAAAAARPDFFAIMVAIFFLSSGAARGGPHSDNFPGESALSMGGDFVPDLLLGETFALAEALG